MSCSYVFTHLFFLFFFFFFNDTATTEIYTLSLYDALPICCQRGDGPVADFDDAAVCGHFAGRRAEHAELSPAARADRKSTRLNSSHLGISYAVFCLKKKKKMKRGIS